MKTTMHLLIGAAVVLAAGCEAAPDQELDQPLDEEPAAEAAERSPRLDAAGEGTDQPALDVDSLTAGAPYITDAEGRALYMLEGEPADSSTCYDACAEEWPPYVVSNGSVDTGTQSLEQDLIGTMERRDGSTQVTYGGHPLYYYHDDTGPGQTVGQDLTDQWGEWYLVRPDGEHVQ